MPVIARIPGAKRRRKAFRKFVFAAFALILVGAAYWVPSPRAGGVAVLDDLGQAVAIQDNGRIVVAGYTSDGGTGSDFAIARYRQDGSLDHSFSGDGRRTVTFGTGFDLANAVAVQDNGRIVVVGGAETGPNRDFAVARLMPDGSLDHGFSGDGKRRVTFGPEFESAFGLAIQANGRIVAAGYTDVAPGGYTNYDVAVMRLKPDGSLDQDFSGDGKRTAAFVAGWDFARDVAISPSGRPVVAGEAAVAAGNNDFAVAQFMADGSLDHSFSGDGKRLAALGPGVDGGRGVAIQANGRIVVGGTTAEQGIAFAVIRLLPGGAIDQSFSGDGRRITSLGPSDDNGADVAIQSNGRIVLAGYSNEGSGNYGFAVARHLSGGGLDQSFSGDGKRIIGFGSGVDTAEAVAIDAAGRVVLAGRADTDPGAGADNDFAVIRLLPGGGLDPSFSANGKATTSF